MASARKPIASDSPRATTPRTTGRRSSLWRAIGEAIERETSAIAPSGLRTATAQFEGPRIITPSRTACPPIAAAIPSASFGDAFELLGHEHQAMQGRRERPYSGIW